MYVAMWFMYVHGLSSYKKVKTCRFRAETVGNAATANTCLNPPPNPQRWNIVLQATPSA